MQSIAQRSTCQSHFCCPCHYQYFLLVRFFVCVCGVVICCIWMCVCIGVFSYLPMRLQANEEKSRDKMQCIRWIIVLKCILCNAIFSRLFLVLVHFFGLSPFFSGQTITIFSQWCKVKLKMKINRQCMDMSTHNPNH